MEPMLLQSIIDDGKYENYIFDLYGTLIDIHTDEENRRLWKVMAEFYRRNGAFYFASTFRSVYSRYVKEAMKGKEEIQVESVFEKLFQKRGVCADQELLMQTCRLFRESSTEYVRLYPWTLPTLQQLQEKGKKIFLLSNAQRSFTYHEMEELDIVKYFDRIFISSDHGVKKPNPIFYQQLIREEQLDVKKSLMIGNDQNCDILGAKQVGLSTCYIHTNCSPEYNAQIHADYEFGRLSF